MRHFLYTPFTGLGLYGGSRGNAWLRDRIKIFKTFVLPSLLNQTSQNFTLWLSFRPQERTNKDVKNLELLLKSLFGKERVVFTYSGVCFYDDKHPDPVARERLITSLHHSLRDLVNYIGDVEDVVYTIQPSDDCYHKTMVEEVQMLFNKTDYQAIGYQCGYIMNYRTGELREYNPETNPPFVSIRFPKAIFMDPFKHSQYTALKKDSGKYLKGTPCPSHEYYGECLHYLQLPKRGFLVGTHGRNISTHFKHPYAGDTVDKTILAEFGIINSPLITIKDTFRSKLMKQLPHRIQRKLRYIFGERIYQSIYQFIHG